MLLYYPFRLAEASPDVLDKFDGFKAMPKSTLHTCK